MLIDWFTVIAQIINFLILVLLLRRFLYRPIAQAMSEREAKIAARLEEATSLKQEAIQEAEAYRQQRRELDNYRDTLLSEAHEEVETWRKDAIHQAREEMDEVRTSWHRNIVAEQRSFMQDLRQRIGSQVCSISRRALADLADAELEQQMITMFLRRLVAMDEPARTMLRQSADRSAGELTLRSAFEISQDKQRRIIHTIHDEIDGNISLRFEVMADLLCGIEISTGDYKLAWSLDNYLVTFEENLMQTFAEDKEPRQHVQP